ncbi:MAG: DUF58 domain-containing protein [Planctomycetes bacterium]|nr:DUF58 domain-containing protein [Planctomycetota bacterium]
MSENRLTVQELLDPAFLDEVSRLQLFARRVARGGRPAEQRSRHLGAGMEFRDFRAYTPGDDFRAIDWNIYRRLGRVVLRLFEELEDLPVYLAVDLSRSMFQGEAPRGHAALKAAFAIAAIALQQHDRVGVFPFAEDLELGLRPTSGRGRQFRIAEVLAAAEPRGRTDLRQAMRRFTSFGLRQGLLVIISDFFDPAGIEAVAEALRGLRHRLLLVQLFRKADLAPSLSGDLRVTDCETGEAYDISATREVVAAYRQAYERFQDGLLRAAQAKQAGFLRLDVDENLVEQLAAVLAEGDFA